MFTTKHVNRHYAMDMRKALATQCAAVGEHICSDRSAWLKENTARWVGNSVQKNAALRGHGLGAFANSTFCSQPAGDSPIRLSVIDALSVGCIPVFFHKEQLDIWRLQMGDWIRDASVFFDHADVIACNNTMRRQWIKRKNKAAAKAAAKAAKAEASSQTRAAAKERWKGNVTLTRQRKLLSATEAVEECTDGTPLNIIDALRAIPESEIRSMREVLAANYYKMIVDPSLVEVRALHSVVPVLSSGGSGSAGSPRSVGGRCSLPPHVSEIFARLLSDLWSLPSLSVPLTRPNCLDSFSVSRANLDWWRSLPVQRGQHHDGDCGDAAARAHGNGSRAQG